MAAASDLDVLTAGAALVSATTAFFAVVLANRQRHAAVLPKVVIEPIFLPGGFSEIRLVNVGPGPALDVEVTVSVNSGGESWVFRTPVLPSGAGRTFAPAALDERMDRLPKDIALSLSGRCKNALGATIKQVHQLDFAAEIKALERGSPLRSVEPEPQIDEALGALTSAVEKLASRVSPPRRKWSLRKL